MPVTRVPQASVEMGIGASSSNYKTGAGSSSSKPEASSSNSKLRASNSKSKLDGATPPPGIRKVNDAVWQFHNPKTPNEVPIVEIIFFHGLQLGDYENAFWKTWLARSDENVVWPKDWLGATFPTARILAISYDSSTKKNHGQLDMYRLVENLVSDIIMDGLNIGQTCPIIMVGHCLGGIVIKQFILCAERMKAENCQGDIRKSQKIGRFLQNIKGIFYYASPHGGFNKEVNWAKQICSSGPSSELLQLLLTNGKERERINDNFRKVRENGNIRACAIVENLPSEYLGTTVIVVDEESGRRDIDSYYTVKADHFDICRPDNMETSGIFRKLQGFIESILEEALQQGFENFQQVPKEVIGLDGSMKVVCQKLLENQTVGIFGMGGIGKTTLAKALFNELKPTFEYSCFVPEVKSIPGTAQEVMGEVQNHMHHLGTKIAGPWIEVRRERLLLVLDDVGKYRDLAVLARVVDIIAPGSRCIVTSRDKELLSSNDMHCYEMPFLSKEHAKHLFISHAFSTPFEPPLQMLEKHVDKIVKQCDGLPLTLEVMGKYLKSKRNHEKIWEQTLEALNDGDVVANFEETLWNKLRVSYNGLGEPEKQMFLDATTFFSDVRRSDKDGWTLRDAKAAWSALYSKEQLRWQTLVDLSLVYHVEEDKKIKVHEQLQSMGRRIALECKDGKLRRWWKLEGGLDFLRSKDEPHDQQISSLRLSSQPRDKDAEMNEEIIPRSCLLKLKKLQFLDVEPTHICRLTLEGAEEKDTLPTDNLVLLRCQGLQLFNPAICPRLAVLKLDLRLIRNLPRSFGGLSALKILTLESFDGETLPPEFGHLAQLERLIFRYCRQLRTVPKTFSHLSRLEYLQFWECDNLDTLPERFGLLSRLEHLEFVYCYSFGTLPDSFGDLSALAHLSFWGCDKLHIFPESIKNLAALKRLDFTRCRNLRTVPEFFGQLSALEHLSFQSCDNLQILPSSRSFAQLAKLQYLRILFCCKIKSLPFSTGFLPEALHRLDIGDLDLKTIPDFVKSLPSLQVLQLSGMDVDDIELPGWLGGGWLDEKGTSSWWQPVYFQVQEGKFIRTSRM